MAAYLLSTLFFFFCCIINEQSLCVLGEVVQISNDLPRLDINGEIMDAHDGNVVQWEEGGLYYFYGMSYGTCTEESSGCAQVCVGCCGFQLDHNVSVWTSPSLASGSWTYVGNALPVDARPTGIYYRPKVVYNPNTKLYVLWTNVVPGGDFSLSIYVAATSPTPVGPFTVQRVAIPTLHAAPGDFDIMVDDDGSAYLIYTSVNEGHNMSIEKLTEDFLNSTLVSSGFFGETFVEAPALFKRNGVYYAAFSHCCCFCEGGSGIGTYGSTSPLGPYKFLGDIGCNSTIPPPAMQGGCGATESSVTGAQQNCVFTVQTTSGIEYLWTGDRWQSAPDHIKAHDLQYWTPLVFNDSALPYPTLQHLTWTDSFTIDLA